MHARTIVDGSRAIASCNGETRVVASCIKSWASGRILDVYPLLPRSAGRKEFAFKVEMVNDCPKPRHQKQSGNADTGCTTDRLGVSVRLTAIWRGARRQHGSTARFRLAHRQSELFAQGHTNRFGLACRPRGRAPAKSGAQRQSMVASKGLLM